MQTIAHQTKFGSILIRLGSNTSTQQVVRREISSLLTKNTSTTDKKRAYNDQFKCEVHKNTVLFNINDSRKFASLAWLGLWGKTPEKSTEPLKEDDAITKVSSSVEEQTPSSDATATLGDATATSSSIDTSLGYIPEPPAIVDESVILNALGEPTLQSLGLGSWWPWGCFQTILEAIHVNTGLEWFESIAIFAVALRICLLPITISSQRNAGKMRKVAPGMKHLQAKMNDARATNDYLGYAKAANELQQYMKMHNMSFLSMLKPLAQLLLQ